MAFGSRKPYRALPWEAFEGIRRELLHVLSTHMITPVRFQTAMFYPLLRPQSLRQARAVLRLTLDIHKLMEYHTGLPTTPTR